MKPEKRTIKIILLVALFLAVSIAAIYRLAFFEPVKERISGLMQKGGRIFIGNDSQKINSRGLLENYFNVFGYIETWTEPDAATVRQRKMLAEMLNYADSLGLNPVDYHAAFVEGYDSLLRSPNTNLHNFKAESEIIFTDAAISFLHDVAYGRDIATEFNGVKYKLDSARITNMYDYLLSTGNWRATLDSLEPHIEQYLILKDHLNRMKAFLRDFPEVDTSVVDNTAEGELIAMDKLRFYGCLPDSIADTTATVSLHDAVVEFQKMMSIDTSGTLDVRTVDLLNEPLVVRVKQINESLNYWRWTGRIREREFVLVNIPAARLQIIDEDSARELSMKVIVGKANTRTPSFTAYISKVIAYPYWNVPYSIATKEMLPIIKKDNDYLDRNNLQVLDNKGNEVDPSKIRWRSLNEKNFPYRIRQSTGCDNALGVLKFEINSPFSIYLHDTNRRDLFSRKERFMSHGCIRVEKPMELANYVLATGLDSVTMVKLNQCLKDETPTEFKLKKIFPVLILYMTADIDANGTLHFYKDIYGLETVKEV